MDPIYTGGLFILGAVVWVVCAVYAYRHAPDFGRTPINWGILGIVFGPIAVMVLYVLPKKASTAGKTVDLSFRQPRALTWEYQPLSDEDNAVLAVMDERTRIVNGSG